MALNSPDAKRRKQPGKRNRYFTLGEAHRALPLVQRIAADIQRVELERRDLVELAGAIPEGAHDSREMREIEHSFDKLTERLAHFVEELVMIGVELKDPLRGLLDFPAIVDGREILLCWQIGEPALAWWHEVDAGYSGRRPICELECLPAAVG